MNSTDSLPNAGDTQPTPCGERLDPATPNPQPDGEPAEVSREPLDIQFELAWLRHRLSLTTESIAVRVDAEGRFEIVDLLGRGGMGAVYLANDNIAQRKVALKVVAAQRAERDDMQRRLLQEARAMAQIGHHPNVAQIHDVRVAISGEYFIVIEYIEGVTLREWQQGRERGEIVAAYLAAARGLAAAHEAGVVHRDFKADNVLVAGETPHWRVAVTDFGLASGSLATEIDARGLRSGNSTHLGTLAYMAPEQYLAPATMQSDQYAWCVSLWEALTGARPFGESRSQFDELPYSHPSMPSGLYRILRRGLSWRAHDRFATMAELVEQLEVELRRQTRRRWWVPITGVLGTAALIAFALRPDPCAAEQDKLDAIWNAAVEGEVRAALAAIDAPWLPDAEAHAITSLDRAAAAWQRTSRAICERGEPSPRERACLDGRLEQLQLSIDRLREGDTDFMAHLPDALEPLLATHDGCELASVVDPRVRAHLHDAELAEREGRLTDAEALAEDALMLAEGLEGCKPDMDYSSEYAAALYRLGHVYGEREAWTDARATLHAAATHALACGDPLLFDIRAHEALVTALGSQDRRDEAAATLADANAMLAALVPAHVPSLRRVEQLRVRAHVESVAGNLDGALDYFDRALALLDELDAAPLATRVRILHNMATTLQLHGRNEDARQTYREATRELSAALGEGHPEALRAEARIDINEALMHIAAGELRQADAKLDAARHYGDAMVAARAHSARIDVALEQRHATEDPDEIADWLVEIGLRGRVASDWLASERELSSLARAELLANIGEALAESSLGVEDELVDADGFEDGVDSLREAIVVWDTLDPVNAALARYTLANLLVAVGRIDEAEPLLAAIRANATAMQDPELASALDELEAEITASRTRDD